ncbi:hypothetical protein [Erythrobacter sp. JK5]|uniref:hypothetical protein n=1 Tax=Erythrobacter sp. JK5 TaxID=2829500 RepID=UPI001BA8AC93|nr:hypothetical protein [Erythrobacter sp. JK5]QUL36581.1 hypothetical protein KDC96_09020 [Erythrobacter sp. JK5]
MKFRNVAMATAALSLAAVPAVAEASFDRSSAAAEGESLEGKTGILLTILGVAAIVAAVLIIDDSDDDAVSP